MEKYGLYIKSNRNIFENVTPLKFWSIVINSCEYVSILASPVITLFIISLYAITPKITSTKGEHEVEEGCLSFPNEYAKVVRPKELTVEALDREGKKFKLKAKDLLAQAVAHEIDHLDGIVFIDRMIPGTLEYVDNSQN